jgi:hypothetical protein
MTLTIADRWSVTFGVQSLARVTMPSQPAAPAAHAPEAVTMVEKQRIQSAIAADRVRWETEAYFCGTRRMF